ncbi:acetyltransferase [Salipiger aestuarii]|uniref:L-amino acid N-acyltransferase YncA n=1 Tax=Salipiger aestuarii TaxID=568098 RepID=A0A327YML3_9RHOB|nr:GNAT family N-acetyltransferase [Salipiger aestuarii]EIE50119.1 N-acetyltransferase [Citreicella sp. 357]KAA8609906.1 acetyltransferase [Salipiger aestuarii]KAA8616218.1 acetyltransferase [Salipiger aestuarii]KAB2543164.1 acetyltransferase [Salipiger aestuarii]RAK21486.1 L-amino acid N-acyltransferase YncA [Salipiger aestuarii]
MIDIRRAAPLDARDMAALLSDIVATGGSTAMTDPVSQTDMLAWMEGDPRSIWHIAEDAVGDILGFQFIEPHRDHGATVGQIGTFAKAGKSGLGIGSKLFEATKEAARVAGYRWINAEIRADNAGGLIFYQSRGFEDWGRIKGYVMANGQVVDKVLKRYDL